MAAEKIEGLWYVLSLVDVRTHVLGITPAARARSVVELQALIDRERVPLYEDGELFKSFRKGGPLEWREDPQVCGMGNVSPCYAVPDIPAHAQIVRAEVVREIPTVDELAARGREPAKEPSE